MGIPVLYIRSSFNPGGTESLLLDIFNYQQNDIVFHFALLKDGILIDQLESKTNFFYRVFRTKKIDLRVIRTLNKIISENGINIIHTHQTIELFYACILKICKPTLKLYHTIHGYHTNDYRWAAIIEIFLIKFVKKVFTVSHSTRNILIKQNYPEKKLTVIYNAVKIPKQANFEEEKAFLKLLNYQQDDKIIGMIGNFVWWKDQITIIKAFNLLQERIPQLKLVFIGNNNTDLGRVALKEAGQFVSSRIFFLGTVPNAVAYLKFFDLFIFSTIADTFGVAVIEALLNKKSVLASDIDVMKEISQNGKIFKLFRKSNYTDLAESIIHLLERGIDKTQIEYAYNYVSLAFSYESYFKELLKYYTR